uniref:Uncharacterized protein n=1 Tax=Panagrolaimus davidi TaxID=227884 RepID=A0A914Q0J3_9BILA
MSHNDSNGCVNSADVDPQSEVYVNLIVVENMTDSLKLYSNMNGLRYTETKYAAVNFIAIIYKNETNFDFVFNFIKERLISETSTCRFEKHIFDGTSISFMIGAFIIRNSENQTQKVIKMALPLYFNDDDTEWYFNYNFQKLLLSQAVEINFNNETCFQNYLMNAKYGSDINQTIILYIDSIPQCIELDTLWNKTNV